MNKKYEPQSILNYRFWLSNGWSLTEASVRAEAVL